MDYDDDNFAISMGGKLFNYDSDVKGLIPVSRSFDYILMQYTGLKDKNGVEIYEGDVIKHNDINKPFLVESLEKFFTDMGAEQFDYSYSSEMLEVIGNIYENPELITKPLDTQSKKRLR